MITTTVDYHYLEFSLKIKNPKIRILHENKSQTLEEELFDKLAKLSKKFTKKIAKRDGKLKCQK